MYVELPELDTEVAAAAEAGVVESVKAASDVYAPVAGTVVAINESLEAQPELVNTDPYGSGWFFKLKPSTGTAEVDQLLSADAYQQQCEQEAH